MTKDETKKRVVRTVFLDLECEGLQKLMDHHHMAKPQDLLKHLVSSELGRLQELNTRYGGAGGRVRKPNEDDVPRETPEETVKAIMQLDEKDLILKLVDIGFLDREPIQHEFVAGDPEVEMAKGKRYLLRRQWLGIDSKDEAQIYEKVSELPSAVIRFLKTGEK